MSTAYYPAQKNGDNSALLLEGHFQITAIEGYRAPLVMGDMLGSLATVRNEESGESSQYELYGYDDSVAEYESGETIVGDQYTYDAGNITLDKQIRKSFELGQTQEEVLHWLTTRSDLVRSGARSIAELWERRIHTMVVKAARSSSLTKDGLTIHAGGTSVSRSGGDQETVYPVSVTGAKRLRDDIYQAAKEWDELGIPADGRMLFLTPHLKNVLYQDTTIFSKDLSSAPGDLVKRAFGELGGFILKVTTWLPSTNVAASVDPNTKYHIDARYNGAVGRPVGLFVYAGMDNQKAIGRRVKRSFTQRMWYNDDRDVWMFSCYQRDGFDVLNPEVAKELRVTS